MVVTNGRARIARMTDQTLFSGNEKDRNVRHIEQQRREIEVAVF